MNEGDLVTVFLKLRVYLLFSYTQLTTGPMLDVISPAEYRGTIQGINVTVMNFTGALAPWLLGIMADEIGVSASIWTAIGVSFGAALINAPLILRRGFGPAPKKLPPQHRSLAGEDKDLIEKARRGEWLPPEILTAVNDDRLLKGRPLLLQHASTYEQDKALLDKLRFHAQSTFEAEIRFTDDWLVRIAEHDNLPELYKSINMSISANDEEVAEVHRELGQWFADYIHDSGYYAHYSPILVKQMILSAFPVIMHDKEFTPENAEQALLNMRYVYNRYIGLREEPKYTLPEVLLSNRRQFPQIHSKSYTSV